MVYRVFVEKKEAVASEARALLSEIRTFLGIRSVEKIRIFNRYDVEGISEELFEECIGSVFSEPQVDDVYRFVGDEATFAEMGDAVFGAEAVAKYHFKKTAKELSRSECALIAGSLPNPRKYDSKNPSYKLIKKQHRLEREMQYIPSFPREGEDYDPSTAKGSTYGKK